MTNDTIADVLTRIRNAQVAGHKVVKVPVCRSAKNLLEVLKSEGFIDTYETVKEEGVTFDVINVFLKYYDNGAPVIATAKRVSKPGQRQYRSVDGLPKVSSGLGISIISTSQGVMSDREARKRKIGGEVLAIVS
jgi:small subunit ribosomal protein S8